MPLALTRLAIRSRERSERLAKDGGVCGMSFATGSSGARRDRLSDCPALGFLGFSPAHHLFSFSSTCLGAFRGRHLPGLGFLGFPGFLAFRARNLLAVHGVIRTVHRRTISNAIESRPRMRARSRVDGSRAPTTAPQDDRLAKLLVELLVQRNRRGAIEGQRRQKKGAEDIV